MSDKFNNVPKDEGTKTMSQKEMKLGNLDVLFELWFMDGIAANSIIFDNKDIEELGDEELKTLVKPHVRVDPVSEIIVKRLESGFTFVNFNFTVI